MDVSMPLKNAADTGYIYEIAISILSIEIRPRVALTETQSINTLTKTSSKKERITGPVTTALVRFPLRRLKHIEIETRSASKTADIVAERINARHEKKDHGNFEETMATARSAAIFCDGEPYVGVIRHSGGSPSKSRLFCFGFNGISLVLYTVTPSRVASAINPSSSV